MPDIGVPTPAALRPPALASASDPAKFGRVEADGTVILVAPEGEVVVGQWAAGEPSAGLAFFGRKYDDLVVEIDLIERRLAEHRTAAEQAEVVLVRVREGLAHRSFVGDVAALEARCDRLAAAIEVAKDEARARKAEQREATLAVRRALADEAEGLKDSTSWRVTTERYAAIVEEWKALPRGDRNAEQELWQRISASRTAFDKRRRTHFTELDGQRKDAVARKRDLIAKAEALSTSTDWPKTSKALRDLMVEWKAAPRASRADEDKLWKRFKAAQDAFYATRTATEDAEQETLRSNVPMKESLAAEAEALLPITDLKAAKSALRSIQDRWEKIGDLPRSDRDRVEGRLKKVEEAIRSAEADAWKTTSGGIANDAFTEALERLQKKRDAAAKRGDDAAAAALDEQIASTRALMGR
ncbi:MAG: DUF349 domain-containing protein [Actinomycetes bacterium]